MTTTWLLLVGAILIVSLVMMRSRERFQPEFLDKTQEKMTIATEDSSYAQRTNHVDPAPYNQGPIQGIETAFQVNQYTSYVV